MGRHPHQEFAFQGKVSPHQVAHTLLRTIYLVLNTGQPYQEPIRQPVTEQIRARKAQRLTRELRNLGFEVTLKAKPA